MYHGDPLMQRWVAQTVTGSVGGAVRDVGVAALGETLSFVPPCNCGWAVRWQDEHQS